MAESVQTDNHDSYNQEPVRDSEYDQDIPSGGSLTPRSLRKKYQFIKEIGHGTQGKIYKAKPVKGLLGKLKDTIISDDDGKEIYCAVKQLNIQSTKNWKEYELFKREAKILETLDIDGVARFYEAIECLNDDPPCAYIVQEFIEGENIATLMRSGRRFRLEHVYGIIIQLVRILKKLKDRENPVVHRDIKPSNVILKPLPGDRFKVYLIDFGAVANPQVQGGGSTVAGTFGYMPPEQLMGRPEPASDVYSLAALAVYLLSGVSPESMPVKKFRLIIEPYMVAIHPSVVNILNRMLEPGVSERLVDLDVIETSFEKFSQGIYSEEDENTNNVVSISDTVEVENYCDDINYEIWKSIPEKSPRPYPGYFIHWMTQYTNQFPKKNISEIKDFHKKSLINRMMSGAMMKPALITILDLVILLLLKYFFKMDNNGFYAFSTFAFFLIICIFISSVEKMRVERREQLSVDEEDNDDLSEHFVLKPRNGLKPVIADDIKRIVLQGRKIMATIVSIDYCAFPAERIEKRMVEFESLPDDCMKYSIYQDSDARIPAIYAARVPECDMVCHGRPSFRIRYKFNPVDDSKDEDLIHEIYTHIPPENHYKVGDPLPILYYIHQDYRGDKEYVDSLPFPFPVGDMERLEDMVYIDR